MKIHEIAGLVWFICSPLCFAEGEAGQIKFDTLLGYKNVVVMKVEPDGIRIRHEDGMKKLKFEDLPKDIRDRFNLNEAAAKEYRVKLELAEAEAVKTEQEQLQKQSELQRASYLRFTVKGNIKQVYPRGVILKDAFAQGQRMVEEKIPYEVQVDGPTAFEPNRPVRKETRFKVRTVPETMGFSGFVFVKCDTSKLNNSRSTDFQIEAYEVGNYKYRQGLVPGFSTDPADAGKKMEMEIE